MVNRAIFVNNATIVTEHTRIRVAETIFLENSSTIITSAVICFQYNFAIMLHIFNI